MLPISSGWLRRQARRPATRSCANTPCIVAVTGRSAFTINASPSSETTTMKLCRFDDDRLGLVEGDAVLDVTEALAAIPPQKWPYRHGDALVAHLPAVLE